MTVIARLLLLLVVVLVGAGPAAAMPLAHSPATAIGAPVAPASTGSALVKLLGLGVAAFGAIRIKDTGSLAKKFVQRASAAQGDYTEGVKAAGADWEANTKAAEDNYKIGVTQAANDGRFGRGVSAAGAGKYTARASTLGAQRYPTGVGAAEGDWAKGSQPYLQTLASIQLPPRRPKGDPGNFARSQAIATALRSQKLGK
jgi:hypothetical protein